MFNKIHVTGASGAGTTTFGKTLSNHLNCKHFDSDNYFWLPTDPPYETSRKIDQRQQLLRKDLLEYDRWVLSGSLCGWGDFAIDYFDLVIFLYVSTSVRIKRLKLREYTRFGDDIMVPGTNLYDKTKAFLEWAEAYDNGDINMRSLTMHNNWLKNIPCRVIRFKGDIPIENLMESIISIL